MKKLKIYQAPDFKLLEAMVCKSPLCGSNTNLNGDTEELNKEQKPREGDGGTDEFDAPPFREGIWDN